MSIPKLFQPIRIGEVELAHRVVLAPLTRNRCNIKHVHGDLAVEYYSQRGTVPGTLLITEAITICPQAGGRPYVPGIWNEEQMAAWKRVTAAVHEKGSFIFAQLRAYGRSADPKVLAQENPDFPHIGPSDIPVAGNQTPRPLTTEEIEEYVRWFTEAAKNAKDAGFDGVELHGANGYLIDQFLSDVTNKRTDKYGGSPENRCRFALEVLSAVTKVIGEKKVAIRLSPWSTFQDMRMEDPVPTFRHLVIELARSYPELAYLHVVEPGTKGPADSIPLEGESNDFIRKIWAPRPVISTGGFNRQTALETAESKGDLIGFGRAFIANPDLPLRLQKDIPLNLGDRSLYYAPEEPRGYIDYPFATGLL